MKNQLLVLPKVLIVALVSVVAGLLVYISFFNCPSILDDYCFAYTARTYGFWTAQKMYYEGWTGRYFSNFLFHLNPLYFSDSRVSYIIIPIVLFAGFIVNSYYLVKVFFDGSILKKQSIFIALSFVCLYYFELPSIVENNFWMIGSYTFVSGNMLMLLINLLLRYYKKENDFVLFLLIAVLYFLILGSSEVSMLCSSVFISFIALFKSFRYKKIFKEDIILLMIAAIGNFLVINAPGNEIRNPSKRDIVESLIQNIKISSDFLIDWTLDSPWLLLLTVAYMLLLANTPYAKEIIKIPISISWAIFFIVFYIAFIPTTYGMGEVPPPRILNLIYLIFLIAWFYNITALGTLLEVKISGSLNILLIIALMIFSLFLAYKNENLRGMYQDIRYKKTNAYLAVYKSRVALLKSSESKSVVLKPIKTKPFSLYTGDVTQDPKHLWNRCLGGYYHNKEIYLENFNQ